jgi:hypothetical protein
MIESLERGDYNARSRAYRCFLSEQFRASLSGILASRISLVRGQVNAISQEFQNPVRLFHCRPSIAFSPLLKGLYRDSCCVGNVETVFLYDIYTIH